MSTNTQNGEQPETAGEVALRANAVIDGLRHSLANELGDSGHDARDWYDTFGWPNRGNDADWDADNYYALYLRNAYAYAVVAQKPKTTWKHEPEVRDRADQEEDVQDDPTEFERAITKLDREHDVWHYAHRVDRMAGIGRHGLLVIDYADTNGPEDFEEPFTGVENAGGLDMVNGYRVYPEPMIEDIDWGKPGSDRWGEPITYQIDLGDDADAGTQDEEETTLTIHHSRVVDVPARVLDDDETRARPRQEPVLNNILDIEKTLGSTAELSYRAADYGINVNLDPEKVDTSGDALDTMEDDLQDWYHGLQPFFRTTGADVNRLGGEVKDPTGIVDNNVRAIATQTGIPQRVLEGASLGELASAEKDEEQYYGLIGERQRQYAEPYIARAIVDHHLEDGALPAPEGDWYDFEWPDLSELSEQEAATVKETRANVVANLQTAVPGLGGERAEGFVETGEFPEREEQTANQLDEDDPRVQEAFGEITGTANAVDPDGFWEIVVEDGVEGWRHSETDEFVSIEDATLEHFADIRTANATRYSEGDEVDTPDGVGVVVEIRTEDFEGPDGDVESSDDSPAYVVGTEDGAAVFRASELESTTIDVDVDNPTGQLTSNAANLHDPTRRDILQTLGLRANQEGHFEWPESWEESETPARVIALKAWAGLGGRFTTCRREMAGEIASPSRFCADFKDRILQWHGWRQGG